MINLTGIVLYKVGNILFFLVPYIALRIVGLAVMDGLRAADCEQRTCSADLILLRDKHRVLKARFRGVGVVSAILRNLSPGSRLRDRRYDDSPQLFESHLARILVSF